MVSHPEAPVGESGGWFFRFFTSLRGPAEGPKPRPGYLSSVNTPLLYAFWVDSCSPASFCLSASGFHLGSEKIQIGFRMVESEA